MSSQINNAINQAALAAKDKALGAQPTPVAASNGNPGNLGSVLGLAQTLGNARGTPSLGGQLGMMTSLGNATGSGPNLNRTPESINPGGTSQQPSYSPGLERQSAGPALGGGPGYQAPPEATASNPKFFGR